MKIKTDVVVDGPAYRKDGSVANFKLQHGVFVGDASELSFFKERPASFHYSDYKIILIPYISECFLVHKKNFEWLNQAG